MRVEHYQTAEVPAFRHVVPPLRLHSGPDSLAALSRELERVGSRRAVVVCGRSLAQEGVLLGRVREAAGGRCAGIVSEVRTHTPLPAVLATAGHLKELGADAMVAVGGGSAVVTARAAAILLTEPGDIRSLATAPDGTGGLRSPKLPEPKLPLLVVPTTPNTAMVKAGAAVSDPVSGERLALFDPKTRAQAVLIDPGAIVSAPATLVRSASLDTFVLAIEGLVSRVGDPLADASLLHSVRLLARNLPDVERHDDPGVRAGLMLAAVLCGQGTDHTGGGIATVLGHAIGPRFGLDNGNVKAVVLPHVLRFNAEAAGPALSEVGSALGLPSDKAGRAVQAIAAVEQIVAELGIPTHLRDMGVTEDTIPAIAAEAFNDWFLRGNPRPVRAEQLRELLKAAW